MKTGLVIAFVLSFATCNALSSDSTIVSGRVIDSKTKLPLINANIGLKAHPFATVSGMDGSFALPLPETYADDTLFVSYVGYQTYLQKLSQLNPVDGVYALEETAMVLDEVTILEKRLFKFEIRSFEASMKPIRGNLYVCKVEVTNKLYNQFLAWLLRSNQKSLYAKYKPDISSYGGSLLSFFRGYSQVHVDSKESKYDTDFDDYPVVNIPHEAAVAYCEWFTDLYNKNQSKKKFKDIRCRLPSLKEWQIAALGYKNFNSWELEENNVETGVPKNSGDEIAVRTRVIPFKGSDILYPWYGVYNYRNKPQNFKNCWLGNFKVPEGSAQCQALRPGGDGYPVAGRVASYFPNGMGLFDVVGNAAEMIDEKGKACGGSWNHPPEESTIVSVNAYEGTSGAVGFRIFMEVNISK